MANQTSIRRGQQPIKSEGDASGNSANGGVNERDATPSKEQTIKDSLSEQIAMANKRDQSETRKLHEIAINQKTYNARITRQNFDNSPQIQYPRSGENIPHGRMNTTHYYNQLLTF